MVQDIIDNNLNLKMKKIIIGFFAITLFVSTAVYAERGDTRRDDDRGIATSTRSELKDKARKNATSTKNVDVTCVSNAIMVREEAISDAWEVFSTDIATILGTRKSSLTEAWKITDSKMRKEAVKKAWETAKQARKSAANEYKTEKKNTWSEFKTAAKSCGTGVGSEAMGESEGGEKIEI